MSSETLLDIDGVLRLGRYTVLICVTAEFLVLSQLSNMHYMVYAGAAPTIRSCGLQKFSSEMSLKDVCEQLNILQANETCKPDLEYDFMSLNVEFSYFCHDTRLVKNSISVQMFGVIIGSFLFGHVGDAYGRKPTMVFCLFGCALFGILSAFSNDLLTATIYRTAIGFCNSGQIAVLIVYMLEILPKKDRVWMTTLCSWSPNTMVLAVIAYYSANWRRLAITISFLTVPAILLCISVYESPRWLIHKGRIDEAHDILKKITHMNGRKDVTNDMIDEVIEREKEIFRKKVDVEKSRNIYHLFRDRKLIIYLAVLSFSFLSTSVINYGLLFNMEKLSGSIYANNIFLGFVRYIISIVSAAIDYTQKWFDRRLAHTLPLIFITIGFLVNFIIICLGGTVSFETIARTAVLLSFAVTGQIYIINAITSNELFPISLRSTCYSFLQVVSRVGVIIAPQLFLLAELWIAAPFLALVLFALVDLVLFLVFIPETKGRPLRDHLSVIAEHKDSELSRLTPRT